MRVISALLVVEHRVGSGLRPLGLGQRRRGEGRQGAAIVVAQRRLVTSSAHVVGRRRPETAKAVLACLGDGRPVLGVPPRRYRGACRVPGFLSARPVMCWGRREDGAGEVGGDGEHWRRSSRLGRGGRQEQEELNVIGGEEEPRPAGKRRAWGTTRTGVDERRREEWPCHCRAVLVAGPDAGESGLAKARRGGAGLVAGGVGGYQGECEALDQIRSLCTAQYEKKKGKRKTKSGGRGRRMETECEWERQGGCYLELKVRELPPSPSGEHSTG